MTRMHRAALAYADRLHWPVLPLQPREKAPLGRLVPHGVHDATIDLDRIAEWWTAVPDANIGLACGPKSGLWALDVDPRNGGEGTWDDLLYEHGSGRTPDTVTAETGGGGLHYLFRFPDDGRMPRQSPGPGLDVKGDGGYIVAAPSIHPCWELYRWQELCHPLHVPLAKSPEWLLDLVCPPTNECGNLVGHSPNDWAEIISPAQEGSRNKRLAQVAGLLFRLVPAPVAAVCAELWAENYTHPPLPIEEIYQTINSIARREADRIRGPQ